jgi:hypothetical protein
VRLLYSVIAGVLAVNLGWVLWWVWLLAEERKQRERLRQVANGGGGDMPPWLRISERRKR